MWRLRTGKRPSGLTGIWQVPVDCRAEMASSILVIGGGGMLPGFIPRLREELLGALAPPPTSSDPAAALPVDTPSTPQVRRQIHRVKIHQARAQICDPWFKLRGLRGKIAILNDPEGMGEAANAGSAPAWTPGLMAWVGGSLAG